MGSHSLCILLCQNHFLKKFYFFQTGSWPPLLSIGGGGGAKTQEGLMPKGQLMIMMICFCGMVDWQKAFSLTSCFDHCQILTITNLWHAVSWVWTCTEHEFRLSWMKLCSSHNQYTTVPLLCILWGSQISDFLMTPQLVLNIFKLTVAGTCKFHWVCIWQKKALLKWHSYISLYMCLFSKAFTKK